jgi:CHAD domain-containing protein
MTLALPPDAPLVAGLARLAEVDARTALEGLRPDAEDLDAAVHEARRRSKRVRALLRLLASGMDDGLADTELRRHRDVGRTLSELRDAQVLDTVVGGLTPPDGPLGGGALDGLRDTIEQRHRAARAHAVAPAGALGQAADLLAGGLAVMPWPVEDDPDVVRTGLRRAARRARKAAAAAAADPTDEHLHTWRKRTKDLRHAVEALTPAWPAALTPLAGALHDLTDLLGEHHDLGVLAGVVADPTVPFGAPADRQAVLDVIARRRVDLVDRAQHLGALVHAERPRALARRVAVYLEQRAASGRDHGGR